MRVLITQRVENLVYNKKYFEFWRKNTTKTGDSYTQYESEIIRFIEYFEIQKKAVTQVVSEDINEYILTIKRSRVGYVFRASLIEFFNIIKEISPTSIEVSFFSNLKIKKIEREAKPLSIDDVLRIRNKLATNDTYYLLFAFEVFYVHGITISEVGQLNDSTYSLPNHTFSFLTEEKKEKTIKFNDNIAQLIEDHPDLLEKRKSSNYFKYIRQISEVVQFKGRDKIIWGDIKETRDTLFLTCPQCKEKYPNSAEFWALIEFKEDINKTHWIYCKECADEMREKV